MLCKSLFSKATLCSIFNYVLKNSLCFITSPEVCLLLQVQRYEAASTIYGPHTLQAYLNQYEKLATHLKKVKKLQHVLNTLGVMALPFNL